MIGDRPVADVRQGGAVPTAVAQRYWRECLQSSPFQCQAGCANLTPFPR